MKKRVRQITKRNRGRELKEVITELTQYLRGWQHYFKLAMWLQQQGVTESNAWKLAMSDKGWWRLPQTLQVNHATPIKWFKELGLYSLRDGYESLKIFTGSIQNRRMRPTLVRWCERNGGRKASSYSIGPCI